MKLTRNNGSECSRTAPFVRVRAEFDNSYTIYNFVYVIYELQHVPQWDPYVVDASFKTLKEGDSTLSLNWTKHKKPFNVSSHDYCDKVFSFVHKTSSSFTLINH